MHALQLLVMLDEHSIPCDRSETLLFCLLLETTREETTHERREWWRRGFSTFAPSVSSLSCHKTACTSGFVAATSPLGPLAVTVANSRVVTIK